MKLKRLFESKYHNTEIIDEEYNNLLKFGDLDDISDKDINMVREWLKKFRVRKTASPTYLMRWAYNGWKYIPIKNASKDQISYNFYLNPPSDGYFGNMTNEEGMVVFKCFRFDYLYIIKDSDDWFYFRRYESRTREHHSYKCDGIDGLLIKLEEVHTKNWKKSSESPYRHNLKREIDLMSDEMVLKMSEWLKMEKEK